MRLHRIGLMACCYVLVSCGGQQTKHQSVTQLTTGQVQSIQSYGQLLAERERLAASLIDKSPETFAKDFGLLAQIDSQLAQLKKNEVLAAFTTSRLENGFVPLPVIQKAKSEVEAQNIVGPEKWAIVLGTVNEEWKKSSNQVELLRAKLAAQTDDVEKLESLKMLHDLTGDESWYAQRDTYIDRVVADIRKAQEEEAYSDELRQKMEFVRKVRADDQNLMDELYGVDAGIYRKKYFNALSEGNADGAYEILMTLSKSDEFSKIKPKLSSSSKKMAAYFNALADMSVAEPSNLSQSYRWYSQAKKISQLLDVPVQAESYDALIAQLEEKYKNYSKKNSGIGLAYLYLMQEFNPMKEGLLGEINSQEKYVRSLAVKKLSTTKFENSAKNQDYGDVISSAITQYLFQHVPHDVSIIEREQYEAIKRERSLGSTQGDLSAVNLLVAGSVLESKVDSSEIKGKKMLRVTVGKESIPNPGYISWLEQSAAGREGVEKPADTIQVDKVENISVEITKHRKHGVFSVSYRLVNAESGSVIYPDSITMKDDVTDTSSEGVEMGDFNMPFKLAELPSDVEILGDLAKKVAEEIGTRLVKKLENQELRYLEEADRFVSTGNCLAEVDSLGKAIMIMKLKSQDTEEVVGRFGAKTISCQTGIAKPVKPESLESLENTGQG